MSIQGINYRLAVQDEEARKSLLALLDDYATWDARVQVIPGLYHNQNAKGIAESENR